METRYGVDVNLPDSGLPSLELVTELYASISSTCLMIACQGPTAQTTIRLNDTLQDLTSSFTNMPFIR